MRDAPHFAFAVRHDVIAFALATCRRARALRAKIDIAVELAHDQQVDRRRDFGTQRRAVLQPGEQLGRAQIGEQPEFGTQAEDRLLGAQMALDVIEARIADRAEEDGVGRSEEHTSELQSLMRISYAVFCLKKKKT